MQIARNKENRRVLLKRKDEIDICQDELIGISLMVLTKEFGLCYWRLKCIDRMSCGACYGGVQNVAQNVPSKRELIVV